MTASAPVARQASCVVVAGRGILIEGPSGCGKSSLALALVDRGAQLIGDDGVLLSAENKRLIARPHPRTRGLMEVRNLGLLPFSYAQEAPVAVVLMLDADAPRYIEQAQTIHIAGVPLPLVHLWPQDAPPALKAELALQHYGLHF